MGVNEEREGAVLHLHAVRCSVVPANEALLKALLSAILLGNLSPADCVKGSNVAYCSAAKVTPEVEFVRRNVDICGAWLTCA